MSTKIRGFIEYIFYPKTGLDKEKNMQYAGFKIQQEKRHVVCFGMVPRINIGDYFEFTGEWTDKTTFKFDCAKRVDDDVLGATSMLIFVFGPKSATKVIHKFNDDAMKAWDIFKNHEQKFWNDASSIKGIGTKKIEKAYNKYENHIAVDVIFNKFSKYGLMLNKALIVYAAWGNDSLKRINENPYNLVYLDKIPFQTIDKIAMCYYSINKTDERRIYAGVLQVMKSINSLGHTFMRFDKTIHYNEASLLDSVQNLLNVDKSLIKEEIFNLLDDKKLVIDKQGFYDIIYLPHIYKAETGVANIAKDFVSVNTIFSNKIIDEYVCNYEIFQGFELAAKQKDAVKTAVQNRFSIISGPPGSGKTTIIDCICSIFNGMKKGCRIKLAAPTGKAAKRMAESTGMKAETVHRMLKYNPQGNAFTFNASNPLEADVIIIDEFSMMSMMLTYQLFQAIPPNCIIILVGDKNQLPSVDAGKVLEDFLAIPYIPKVILDKIYRQDNKSTILQRALDISKDIVPDLSDADDFTFWEESEVESLKNGLIDLYYEECVKYGLENVLLLTPMNKGELGVDILNSTIQEHCNPNLSNSTEIKSGKRIFRKFDRVIQLTNEDEYGVYNGMVGSIIEIIKEDKDLETKDTIVVDFGDNTCEYTRDRFENIKHAYAMTIHKCQGSEAQSVIMVCHSSQKFMLRKKLIYTGMTRAKKHLHLVGEKSMINYSLTNKEVIRNSKLKEFLM